MSPRWKLNCGIFKKFHEDSTQAEYNSRAEDRVGSNPDYCFNAIRRDHLLNQNTFQLGPGVKDLDVTHNGGIGFS